jgi:perosamine synthetase
VDRPSISQMEPWFDEKEAAAVAEYFGHGGWVTEFEKTREFERMIAAFTGAKFCSILPNGTISLTVALQACAVKAGDEVIVPDYTMVATPNAAELIGARVVFADIERDTLCLDYDSMVNVSTPRTRAVMLVSINGRYPRQLDKIVSWCKANDVELVEDSAQSLGSFHGGVHCGRIGHVGSFSFSAPKIITTGQGGALITDDEELIARIRLIRDFGREKGGVDHYLVMGWNYKFTDVQAVIGIEQMKKLPWRVSRKKILDTRYRERLSGIRGMELPSAGGEGYTPWFYEILAERKAELKAHLKSSRIGTRDFYPPLHAEPVYDRKNLHFPVAEEISRKGLWLPSSSKLKDEDVDFVCEKIGEFYHR